MNYYTETTELGDITIIEDRGFVTSLLLGNIEQKAAYKKILFSKYTKKRLSDTLENAFTELEEYLNGKRKTFDIPLNPKGSIFQQKVWSSLLSIPYGETRSYKDIALLLGDENSSRAIGNANNKNPIPIFIPCHRVISSDGTIGGYSGGKEIKTKLLSLERENSK